MQFLQEILLASGNYPGGNTSSFGAAGAPNPFQVTPSSPYQIKFMP
jgi:hypothetical protein